MNVRVARDPDDGRVDEIDVTMLANPRWDFVTGGSMKMLEKWSLFATVNCTDAPNVAHWGGHGECPHRIKVYVSEDGTDPAAYAELVKRAGVRPTNQPTAAELRMGDLLQAMTRTLYRALEEEHIHHRRARSLELFQRVREILEEFRDLFNTYIESAKNAGSKTQDS